MIIDASARKPTNNNKRDITTKIASQRQSSEQQRAPPLGAVRLLALDFDRHRVAATRDVALRLAPRIVLRHARQRFRRLRLGVVFLVLPTNALSVFRSSTRATCTSALRDPLRSSTTMTSRRHQTSFQPRATVNNTVESKQKSSSLLRLCTIGL